MITELDVYIAFRRASGKPYKLPKDWIAHMQKMPKQNREALETVTKFFNTKWNKIDLDKFMKAGFELFPKFTYVKFFDSRVINLYISKDKNEKRNLDIDKAKIIESAKFIKKFIMNAGLINLKNYARSRDGFSLIASVHYNLGKIHPLLFYYMIYKKYMILTDEDLSDISYIKDNMRSLKSKLLSCLKFIETVEESINAFKEGSKIIDVDTANLRARGTAFWRSNS